MFNENCYENLSYIDLAHSNDLGIGNGPQPVGILSGQTGMQFSGFTTSNSTIGSSNF